MLYSIPLTQWSIGLTMMLDGHHSLWLFGITGVVVSTIASLLLLGTVLKDSKPTWKGFAGLLLWSLLIIPSLLQNWGGKTDYYRGVLAEHRHEWALAAKYYESSLKDPTAPEIVTDRFQFCVRMNLDNTKFDLEF